MGPIAWTMTAIGDGWSALIIDKLLHHRPARFQDFRIWLVSLPPSTLSARLRYLEERGVIERRVYQERPQRCEYALTEFGRSLGPVFQSMRAWGREGMMRNRALAQALRRAAPPGRHISLNDVPFNGLPAEGIAPGLARSGDAPQRAPGSGRSPFSESPRPR
ncbi:MAG TPA: helix-turn-helix domain-containing protein [Burkholderiaceae bacterium]|nr:helix-turn-helix domain-containing protein [Burkholderiaceae bacterium]